MDVAVVYESHYGQTRKVAEAVVSGLREGGVAAQALTLGETSPEMLADLHLLVLGAPTHQLGMSRPWTRARTGTGRDAEGVILDGVREWLADLVPPEHGRLAAAFDTRLPAALAGGAVRGMIKGLRSHGYTVLGEGQEFVVEGADGPLRSGEEARAHAWGGELARMIADRR